MANFRQRGLKISILALNFSRMGDFSPNFAFMDEIFSDKSTFFSDNFSIAKNGWQFLPPAPPLLLRRHWALVKAGCVHLYRVSGNDSMISYDRQQDVLQNTNPALRYRFR